MNFKELFYFLCVSGILKTKRLALRKQACSTFELEDEPHTLYIYMDYTKMTHTFQPGKTNEFVVTIEDRDTVLQLSNQDGIAAREKIVRPDPNPLDPFISENN